jgi:hypothetical protein
MVRHQPRSIRGCCACATCFVISDAPHSSLDSPATSLSGRGGDRSSDPGHPPRVRPAGARPPVRLALSGAGRRCFDSARPAPANRVNRSLASQQQPLALVRPCHYSKGLSIFGYSSVSQFLLSRTPRKRIGPRFLPAGFCIKWRGSGKVGTRGSKSERCVYAGELRSWCNNFPASPLSRVPLKSVG